MPVMVLIDHGAGEAAGPVVFPHLPLPASAGETILERVFLYVYDEAMFVRAHRAAHLLCGRMWNGFFIPANPATCLSQLLLQASYA